MAISRVIPFIATKFRVSPEQIEATRVILHKPPALLAVLKSASPLPKEVLQDPSLAYIYPAAFIQWSKCMHGLAEWDTGAGTELRRLCGATEAGLHADGYCPERPLGIPWVGHPISEDAPG
ncbi:hypothetical protein NW837_00980, partial [Synechococcus sp. R6-10]|uniref:hypothetical protein n=1 Tax=Synechococcus sp. R6-10 TaxID=2291956 RepID=UPI0039C45CC9